MDTLNSLERSGESYGSAGGCSAARNTRQWRTSRPERLQAHWLWWPVSTSGQTPSLLLQAVRPRYTARSQGRRQQERVGIRHEGARAEADRTDGHLQTLVAVFPRRHTSKYICFQESVSPWSVIISSCLVLGVLRRALQWGQAACLHTGLELSIMM